MTILITTDHKREEVQQRNYELEEELDAQRKETKQSLTELSEYVDKLRQLLDQKGQENDQLKEKIFELEDSVEQQIAINKYDKHVAVGYAREIEQIEDQKIEVQKKYDQLIRLTQTNKEEHEQCLQNYEEKIQNSSLNEESLIKTVNSLRNENSGFVEQLGLAQNEIEKLKRVVNHGNPISRTDSELSDGGCDTLSDNTASITNSANHNIKTASNSNAHSIIIPVRRHSVLSSAQSNPSNSIPGSPANVPIDAIDLTNPLLGSKSSKSSQCVGADYQNLTDASKISQNIKNLISSYETNAKSENKGFIVENGFITKPAHSTPKSSNTKCITGSEDSPFLKTTIPNSFEKKTGLQKKPALNSRAITR